MKLHLPRLLPLVFVLLSACELQTQTEESSVSLSTSGKEFVSGTKGVKLILSDATNGSFATPLVVPSATAIPTGYPGAGTGFYLPGISAKSTGYFDLDGTTPITKPSWITDVQLGITALPGTPASCANFGRSSLGVFDVDRFYRVSELDCAAYEGSTNSIPIFIRVILNRDTAYFGTRENLMLQVEYQATGLRANSDGVDANPEMNLDQLWKVFWGQTLLTGTSYTPFSVFIPPNFANWCSSGSGGYSGGATCTAPTANAGAPSVVRQILLPLAADSKQTVIQIQRVRGRVNGDPLYVSSFCSLSDSPLCQGVVFKSLTLLRL